MAEDIEVLVDGWIRTAHERGASDIHIEPDGEGDRVRVRIRVDGQLRLLNSVGEARKILARLKVMAGMDVNSRDVPMDGRITGGGRSQLDLRVSTLPTLYGEKAVLRLIDNTKLKLGIEDLGFSKRMLAGYKPMVESPTGLILHVGPTGSGKTTSLYAVLQTLNRPETNIQTVEDPVEYQLQGITQTQVDHDHGLTFPRILRALLRQDPNVILIGEIRDVETAEIATEAALTGHLVLSTLHTNDAVGTVIRLIEMGIAPYVIAYAVRCVVAQRFVRKLCASCRTSRQPTEPIAKMVGPTRPIFEAVGCKDCGRTGYSGRTPLFEFLPMGPALRKAVYASQTPDELGAVAAKNGLISLWQDGLEKMFAGITSFEEVLRVARGLKDPSRPGAPAKTATRPAVRPAATPTGARPVARPGATGTRPTAPPRPATRPPG